MARPLEGAGPKSYRVAVSFMFCLSQDFKDLIFAETGVFNFDAIANTTIYGIICVK
jgi:hypothetical protein